jgi:hypothetical protein
LGVFFSICLFLSAVACGSPEPVGEQPDGGELLGGPDGGPAAAPPQIETSTVANATVDADYRQVLYVSGGELPLSFVLADQPTALSWLRIDGRTGALGGTPRAVVLPAQSFTVRVTDRTGRTHQRTYTLQVNLCTEPQSVDCSVSDGDACLVGKKHCREGQFGACSAGTASDVTSTCGPGSGSTCGSCDEASNRCLDGRCKCGGSTPCDDPRNPTCCGNGEEGACTNLETSLEHCGACDNACEAPAGMNAACIGRGCVYTCKEGYQQCPADAPTCVSVMDDPNRCGSCTNRCARENEIPNTVVASDESTLCQGGICQIKCARGYANCNGVLNAQDGCEQPLGVAACGESTTERDVSDRSGCDNGCKAPEHASPLCSPSGVCSWACNPGYYSPCGNTCVPVTDVGNCGGCGVECEGQANAHTYACVEVAPDPDPAAANRTCAVAAGGCSEGFGDCNGTYSDGCEAVFARSNANCGGCGNECTGGNTCTNGKCCQELCEQDCWTDTNGKPHCEQVCQTVCVD